MRRYKKRRVRNSQSAGVQAFPRSTSRRVKGEGLELDLPIHKGFDAVDRVDLAIDKQHDDASKRFWVVFHGGLHVLHDILMANSLLNSLLSVEGHGIEKASWGSGSRWQVTHHTSEIADVLRNSFQDGGVTGHYASMQVWLDDAETLHEG